MSDRERLQPIVIIGPNRIMAESSKREGTTSEIRISSVTDEPAALVGSFFNGLEIPTGLVFDAYKHSRRDEYAVHAESATLDYAGQTDTSDSSEYIVALYDPVHKLADLFRAPLLQGKITARSKRALNGPLIKLTGVRNVAQRNALGEAFGTKKAKKAITDYEKNRIDADKLQTAEMDIVDTVLSSTSTLPSRAEMNESVANDRPTPIPNVDATNVEDIYPIDSIIPPRERTAIRVGALLGESDLTAQLDFLPYAKSTFVAKHLPATVASQNTDRLELLYYASLLFGVYENRRVKDKLLLMTRLEDKPAEILIDGVLERFAVARALQFGKSKDRSFVIDPPHEDKLLCYLLALILHISNFQVELPPLANELNIKLRRLADLFRALGAVIKPCTLTQAEAFGVPRASAKNHKVASLKVPFKAPDMARTFKRSR